MRALALVACVLAGCSALVGIDDFEHDPLDVDPPDAGPPVTVPATLLVGGAVTIDTGSGRFPVLASTPVSFVRTGTGAAVNGVTGTLGSFSLVVPAGGPVSGYVHVTTAPATFQPRQYVFDLVADRNLFIDGFSASRLEGLASFAGVTQTQSTGCMLVRVRDPSTLENVTGATVELGGSGAVRYHSDAMNLPDTAATATGSSGAAWVFDALGTVTVTARRGGRSASRTVEVPGNTFVLLEVLVPL